MTTWVDSARELVAGIGPGTRIGVSGFHFTRTPVAAIQALGPDAVDLHYVAWGGGLPLELLLAQGRVSRATLCFSSLDALGPAPRFRRAVEDGTLELDEWTALGMIAGLRAAGENMPLGTLQEPAGSTLTAGFSVPQPNPFDAGAGTVPMVAVPALHLDVLLLHAQRADDDGNVEIQGARGLDMSMVFAARRVLVTVEERVPTGSLGASRAFVLPRTFVEAVTLAPGGAYPTSCLPHYPADYRALSSLDVDTWASPDGVAEPDRLAQLGRWGRAPARLVVRELQAAAGPDPAPDAAPDPASDAGPDLGPWTVDELMVTTIAATIGPGAVCSVGSASPLPTAAYLLAKHLRAPDLLVMSHNGGLVDLPVRPLSLLAAELIDTQLAAAHTGGDETYHWYYQRGLVTHEVVGSAQVDATGATNNLLVRKCDGTPVRLPGQGGMADVANLHANFMIYLPRQGVRNTPVRVERVSAARTWRDPEQRRRYGLQPGRTLVVTDLGVFEAGPDGDLLLVSVHPGVAVADVAERTGFAVREHPDLTETTPPTDAELHALRHVVDPLGVRRLDMVAAAERRALVLSILDREERILDSLENA